MKRTIREDGESQKTFNSKQWRIPIYVHTPNSSSTSYSSWFFEDIQLSELQEHLTYITEEDIKKKKIHYIFAEEPLDSEKLAQPFVDLSLEYGEVIIRRFQNWWPLQNLLLIRIFFLGG